MTVIQQNRRTHTQGRLLAYEIFIYVSPQTGGNSYSTSIKTQVQIPSNHVQTRHGYMHF